MKRLTYISIAFILLLIFNSGCYIDLDDDPWFGPVVNGSGHVITEERLLPDFDRVIVEGATHVIISQDNDQMVQVEADDNIVPIIETHVRGGELKIETDRRYRSSHEVNVYITIPVISGLRVSGSGNIYSETPLEGDLLELEISGSGNVDVEMYYTGVIAEIDGSGDFRLFGEANEQEIHISGSGNYYAKELLSNDCYIKISGSGLGEVNVAEFLEAEIRGSGDIIYYGDPEIRSSVRGSGNLIRG